MNKFGQATSLSNVGIGSLISLANVEMASPPDISTLARLLPENSFIAHYDPLTYVFDIPGVGKVEKVALIQAAAVYDNPGLMVMNHPVRYDEASLVVASRLDTDNAIARLRTELADRGLPVGGMNGSEIVDLILALAFNTGTGVISHADDR